MTEKIITNNSAEMIKISWDGERFALIRVDKKEAVCIIVLNPREMMDIILFGTTLGEEA